MSTQVLTDQIFDKWTVGKDTSVLTIGTQEPNSIITKCTINGEGAEWGLKMPGNIGSTFTECHIFNGKERALDIVQGNNIKFNSCIFAAGTDRKPTSSKYSLSKTCDIGIKGGASDIQFNDCILTDILLGDHDIYDNPQPSLPWNKGGVGVKVSNITLTNCLHPLGAKTPIILRVYNAEMPKLNNTNAIALVYFGWCVKTYFWVAGKWIDSRVSA